MVGREEITKVAHPTSSPPLLSLFSLTFLELTLNLYSSLCRPLSYVSGKPTCPMCGRNVKKANLDATLKFFRDLLWWEKQVMFLEFVVRPGRNQRYPIPPSFRSPFFTLTFLEFTPNLSSSLCRPLSYACGKPTCPMCSRDVKKADLGTALKFFRDLLVVRSSARKGG